MKSYIKLVAMVLVVALGLGGMVGFAQWRAHKKLQETVTGFEVRIVEITEALDVELNEMDTVGLKQQKTKVEELRVEVQKEMSRHDGKEELMFYELDVMLSYLIESIDVIVGVIENPWDMLTGVTEERLENINNELDKHGKLYTQYKQELEIQSIEDFQNNLNTSEL